MTTPPKPHTKATTAAALAVGVVGALFCLVVVWRTAQLPAGDGTGMQWVVVAPLSVFFLGVVVPALIVGVSGLRAAAVPATPAREREARAFGTFKAFLIALAVLVFGVLPLVTQLILLASE